MNTSLDIEALHRRASGHYLRGEFESAMSVWRELLERAPKDVRAREGVRLCEELAREASAEEPIEAPVAMPDNFVLDLPLAELAGPVGQDLRPEPDPALALGPESETSFDEEFGPLTNESGIDAAALELQHRVEQLVEDAQACALRGEALEALRIIERVLILDEENQDALELRVRLTRQVPGTRQHSGDAESAAASEPDPLLDLTDFEEGEFAPPAVEVSAPSAPEAQEPVAAREALEAEPKDGPAVAAVTPPSFSQLGPRLAALVPRGRVAWLAGVVLLVAAIAGVVGWTLSGHGSPPQVAAPHEQAAQPHKPEARLDVNDAKKPAIAPPAAASRESLSEAVAQGDAASAARDWAAAVLSYDRAAKLAPEDLEVRKKFQVAAAAYQVQQKERERWDEAFQAFNGGNYDQALRCFYRMPGSETDPQILEYKARSWFNLGLTALRGHDCPAAASHLEEARGIRPADREIQSTLALAKDCGKANPVTFPLDVKAIALRPLGN